MEAVSTGPGWTTGLSLTLPGPPFPQASSRVTVRCKLSVPVAWQVGTQGTVPGPDALCQGQEQLGLQGGVSG